MSTTTTVPLVIDAFLSGINTALTGVEAYETWPGPEAAREMVVLEGDGVEPIVWQEYEIPTMKAGRKQRQEAYEIGWAVYVAGAAGTTPANAKPVRDRAFTIAEALQNILAVDPTAGTSFATVQDAQVRMGAAGPRVFEKSWAYRVNGVLAVRARLV